MSKFIAYTDGFFDMATQIGASAVIILDSTKENILFRRCAARKVEYDPTKKQRNNEQELGAIIRAVMSVPNGSEMDIYSDSLYAVNVLSGKWGASANLDLIERYGTEVEQRCLKVNLYWVKGHNGDTYNEMSDALCNKAAESLRNGGPAIFKSENKCFKQ